MTKLQEWRHGLEQAWDSVADGWREMSQRASGALIRFRRGHKEEEEEDGDDLPYRLGSWGYVAADLYDDDNKVVVRLEAPGMKRDDFEVELIGDRLLSVQGRKRFERESTNGRYRMVQCAYGSFNRTVPLPVPVRLDRSKASYRDGVLRIELPKAEHAPARRIAIH